MGEHQEVCFENSWAPEFSKRREIHDEETYIESKKKFNADGDDLDLFFRDSEDTTPRCEVDVWKDFCCGVSLSDVEAGTSAAGHEVVWLDERNCSSERELKGRGDERRHANPLTATGLYRALKEPRFHHENLPDAARRLIYVSDLNPACIFALAATASQSQALVLRKAICKHLTFQASIGAKIPAGPLTFQLDLHLPFFILRKETPPLEEPVGGGKLNTKPKRRWTDLSFLKISDTSTYTSELEDPKTTENEVWGIHEAQISVVVTGSDDWRWVGYGFIDAEIDGVLAESSSDDLLFDQIAAGALEVDFPIWRPRDYWLKVFEVRIGQVRREWDDLAHKLEQSIGTYIEQHQFTQRSETARERVVEMKEAFDWTLETMALLRRLSVVLSATVDVWNSFTNEEIGYFRNTDIAPISIPARRLLRAIKATFRELRENQKKIARLENSCSGFSSKLELRLYLESKEAVDQNEVPSGLTVSALYPIAFPAAIFMQLDIIPFDPTLRSFVLTIILMIAMAYIIRFVGKHVQSRWPLLQKTIALWGNLGTRAIYGRQVEVTDQISRQVNSFGYGLPVPPRCEPTSFARLCPWEQQLEKDGHFAIDLDEQPRNNLRSCSFDATRNSAIITGQPATNSIKRKPLPFKNKEENQGLDRCCSPSPALAERSATDLIDECYDSGIEMYYPSSMRITVDEVARRADGELMGGQVNDEVRGYYAGACDIDYDGNFKIDGVFNNAKRFIQAPATPAIEPAPEHVLEGQGGQSVVFLASDPIERSVIIDSGEDEIGGTPDTAGNDFQPSALRTIEPVIDEVAKERDSIGPLIGLETEQITVGDEVDSKIDGATAVAENDIPEPASSAIESGAEYSEADEADFMKLLSNAPVVIQDSDGESQAVNAVIDTGASSSFISKEVAHQYGLKEMPLPRHEIKSFAAFNCEGVTPKTFVVIQVKCSKIGLNKFVQMSVRVLNNEKFDIIFGRPFIQEHGILHQIIPTPQFDTNGNTLLIIQEKHSEDAKPLVEYEETDSNPTAAVEYTLSVPPRSNSEIDPTAAADTTLSTLSSDVAESESSSMEDDSDSDDDRITEIDARPSIIGIPSVVLGRVENDVNLTNLMRSLKRALVERLMTEFWELFNQEWVDYTRKCPDISKSTTTSQPRPKDKSSAQESTKMNQKRSWGNEENENPDENDRGPPKRPKKVLGPIGVLDSGNKFACPYRKYDPRKYCAHSQNRKWRSCAMTPLADVSRVKSHLYRHHIINQCTRCRETFKNEEELKEHSNAAKECERHQSEEAEGVQGVNANIERRLRSRKKTDSTQSQEDRWKEIFQMLFGNKDMPTPYFEPVTEEVSVIGGVSSPNSQQLAEYEEYSRRELPRLIESTLEQAAQNGTRIIEDNLRRLLPDMIRDCQDQVFSSFRSMLASNIGSPLADTHQGTDFTAPGWFRSSPSMEPRNFALEGLPAGTRSDYLAPFYIQPLHQTHAGPLLEFSPIGFGPENGQRNTISDSSYLTNHILTASSPATSQDEAGTGLGNENEGHRLQPSSDPTTRYLNPSSISDIIPRAAHNYFMSMRDGEIGASPRPPEESFTMTGQEINQMIPSQAGPEIWDFLNGDHGLDQESSSGGQQDVE